MTHKSSWIRSGWSSKLSKCFLRWISGCKWWPCWSTKTTWSSLTSSWTFSLTSSSLRLTDTFSAKCLRYSHSWTKELGTKKWQPWLTNLVEWMKIWAIEWLKWVIELSQKSKQFSIRSWRKVRGPNRWSSHFIQLQCSLLTELKIRTDKSLRYPYSTKCLKSLDYLNRHRYLQWKRKLLGPACG